MIIRNVDRGTVLATAAERADSFWLRLRGLQFRHRFEPFDGLWLEPTNAIHMFWVFFPIDVVWLDASGQVLQTVTELAPWRLAVCRGARVALELPAGMIQASASQVGDHLACDE